MNACELMIPAADELGSLRARDELLTFAVTAGAVGVWEWHPRTGCFMAHPVLLAMMGFDPARRVFGLHDWLSHVDPRDRLQVETALGGFLREGLPLYQHRHRMLDGRGRARLILSRGIVAERSGRDPVRVIGADIDLTGTY